MDPMPSQPAPGSLTVSPLFGWEVILVALLALVALALAVAFVASGALRSGRSDRREWEAWLEGRSAMHQDPAAGELEVPAGAMPVGVRTIDRPGPPHGPRPGGPTG